MKDSFSVHCAPRLVEERTRLVLTQAQAAAACGVSRNLWGQYERGETVPGATILIAFATAGADIQYVLTGKRSPNILRDDEAQLLELYRGAPPAVRGAVFAALMAGSLPTGQTFHGHVTQAINGPVTQRDLVFNVGGNRGGRRKK